MKQVSAAVQEMASAVQAKAIAMSAKVADVFVWFMPHVSSLDVNVHVGGWTAGADPDRIFRVPLKKSEADVIRQLQYIVSYLDELADPKAA